MINSLRNYLIKNKYWLNQILFTIIIAVIVATICIHFLYLPKAPFYNDEILTIYASRGIIEHGIPVFPTGMFYSYSLLNNYSVALSMMIFGDNVIGYRMVSFLFSILNLFLVYFLAKKFFSKTTALIAVLTLSLSQFQTDFSLSARMYMQLQFFTLLYLYAFYRGFFEESKIFKWIAIVALICGIYTKILILIFIPPTILFLMINKKGWWRDRHLIYGFGLSALFLLFMILLPNFLDVPGDWVDSGVKNIIGLSLNYFSRYFTILADEFPIGVILTLLVLLLSITNREIRNKTGFLLINYFLPIVSIALIAKYFRNRYALVVFPQFIILSIYGIKSFFNFLLKSSKSKRVQWIKITSLVSIIIYSISFGIIFRVGIQSSKTDQSTSFLYIKNHIRKGDVVITDCIPCAMMFIDKSDFRIAQKYDNGEWLGYPYDYDVRFGTQILDNTLEVKEVFETNERVWYADSYYVPNDVIQRFISPDIVQQLENNLKLKFIDPDNHTAAYLYEKKR